LILIFDDSRNAAFRERVKAFYDSTLNPRARGSFTGLLFFLSLWPRYFICSTFDCFIFGFRSRLFARAGSGVKQMSQHGEKRPDIDKAILQKEHGANFIADQIKTPQRAAIIKRHRFRNINDIDNTYFIYGRL
jgi:hypothetical protein